MRLLFALLLMFAALTTTGWSANPIQEISYSYGGNHKALIIKPEGPGPFPAIIYNYDEYFEKMGEKHAFQQGYSPLTFMKIFRSKGYICILPINRHNKSKTIEGAFLYLKKQPDVDPAQIHILGISQGAFLSLIAGLKIREMASLTLIMPKTIHDTGHLSLPELLRGIDQLKNTRVLEMVCQDVDKRTLRNARILERIFRQHSIALTYIEYPQNMRWFWNPRHSFMQDLFDFLSPPEKKQLDDSDFFFKSRTGDSPAIC